MTIELTILTDGRVALLSDEGFPELPERLEFYETQKLFVIVYDDPDHEGDMTHYEIPDSYVADVKGASAAVIGRVEDNAIVEAYEVPLIQIIS